MTDSAARLLPSPPGPVRAAGDAPVPTDAEGRPGAPAGARRTSFRTLGLLVAVVALLVVVLLSIGVGTKTIGLERVWDLVLHPDGSDDATIVHDLRIPRTVLGLLVGAALGVSGALMQALTRNPLADPGLLGVNAGAATAIVVAVAVLGTTDFAVLVWFGLLGAALASLLVYALGARGRSGATPVRLALAGTAVTFALLALVQGISFLMPRVFDQYRFWTVGSLAGHPSELILQVAPFMAVGLVLALTLARPLNALALGDDVGRALGASVGRTRVLGTIAVTLLCGGATAAVGPIIFVGLTVPHIARALTGPDQRWVLSYSLVLAPILVLGSDVLGRVIARPGEVQVAIVTAFVGAPVFIFLVRRRRIVQL